MNKSGGQVDTPVIDATNSDKWMKSIKIGAGNIQKQKHLFNNEIR